MKCPKCAYVGFEPAPRCRNCGYEFSLLPDEPPADSMSAARTPAAPALATADLAISADADADTVDLPLVAVAPPAPVDLPLATAAARLPSLFAEPPPPARAPLAVRKTTAERPRSRVGQASGRPRPVLVERPPAEPADASPAVPAHDAETPAPVLARGLAAALDLTLLAAVDAVILYLTLQLSRLTMADLPMLPLVPMLAFIGGLNLAYFVVFTAHGGQTLGKMAAGVRVEGVEGALTTGAAVIRVGAALVGGLLAGAGWWMLLVRADRRSAHDHAAGTRVVKVPA